VERRYRSAYLFAAVFSSGVMIPIGYEFGFRKRLHVVSSRSSDWEKPAFDLTGYIRDVNAMKASLPILNEEGPQRFQQFGDGRLVGLARRPMRGQGWVFILINSDASNPARGGVGNLENDIRGGREVTPGRTGGEPLRAGEDYSLEPGEIRIFAHA
jgi:starch synthase (maltosyl-transferring)